MTIRIVHTVYGPVLMPDTDTGYQPVSGAGAYMEHLYIVRVLELLQARPPGMAVDAGASYGFWSLALAPVAEEVIAIEPQRGVYNMLCGTVALNDLNYRIFPHNVALGAEPGTASIVIIDYEQACSAGGLSIGEVPYPPNQQHLAPFEIIGHEPMRVVRLSDCLDPERRVSFIKMDIEGSESEALQGAEPTIRRWHPPMFVESEHFRTNTAQLRRQIEGLGYEVQELKANFLCLPLEAV